MQRRRHLICFFSRRANQKEKSHPAKRSGPKDAHRLKKALRPAVTKLVRMTAQGAGIRSNGWENCPFSPHFAQPTCSRLVQITKMLRYYLTAAIFAQKRADHIPCQLYPSLARTSAAIPHAPPSFVARKRQLPPSDSCRLTSYLFACTSSCGNGISMPFSSKSSFSSRFMARRALKISSSLVLTEKCSKMPLSWNSSMPL